MNTLQINKILRRNFATHNFFRGCFASDQIPNNISGWPWCIVVNMDPSYMSGSHWVAMFSPKRNLIEYYDSLGMWPPPNPEICLFLDRFKDVKFNRRAIQSTRAKNCGKHVIYFLYNRCRGFAFVNICQRLSKLQSSPDNLVNIFIRKRIFTNV